MIEGESPGGPGILRGLLCILAGMLLTSICALPYAARVKSELPEDEFFVGAALRGRPLRGIELPLKESPPLARHR